MRVPTSRVGFVVWKEAQKNLSFVAMLEPVLDAVVGVDHGVAAYP